MSIFSTLQSTGIPCAYSHFETPQKPPYITYIGSGQETFAADNTWTYRRNTYQVEFYFAEKDEAAEDTIETALLSAGYQYTKSADMFLEDQGVYVIYYDI